MSRFRPGSTVVACLLSEQVRRQMALYCGVVPLLMPYAQNTDQLIDFAVRAAEEAGLVKQGDLVVLTAGVPVGVSGTTNMIKVHLIGGALLNAVGIGGKNASGRLCVCASPEEVADKFRPGDVLVVPYTTNDLLPYIRQAAAVISEESGVNSHAATVGLALDKAVIVGALRRRPPAEGRHHGLRGLRPGRGPDIAPVRARSKKKAEAALPLPLLILNGRQTSSAYARTPWKAPPVRRTSCSR